MQRSSSSKGCIWAARLLRRYRAGEAAIPAFLDDYALFVQALLDLYEAQFDTRLLQLAIDLTLQMREQFEELNTADFSVRRQATKVC